MRRCRTFNNFQSARRPLLWSAAIVASTLARWSVCTAQSLHEAANHGESVDAHETPVTEASSSKYSKLIVMGDVHGDRDAFIECLRLGGLVDEKGANWTGGTAALVQVGDIFDRGADDLLIERYIDSLRGQAAAAGGGIFTILGNHEALNAMGDHSYVTRDAFAPFEDMAEELEERLKQYLPQMGHIPQWARARIVAMLPGGPVAHLLSKRSVAMVVGDSLFVHAGLLPGHLEPSNCNGFGGRECLREMNSLASKWLKGEGEMPREMLTGPESPVWTRKLSMPESEPLDPASRTALEAVLAATGTQRLFVGHTPQRLGINGAAATVEGGANAPRVWRVDVGMTQMIYGRREVLELKDGEVTILATATDADARQGSSVKGGVLRIPGQQRWAEALAAAAAA